MDEENIPKEVGGSEEIIPTPIERMMLEFNSYIRYRIESHQMTIKEAESIARMFERELGLLGTVEDFAKFYGQSTTNVSSLIHRCLISKPVRRVLYSFREFRKIVPKSWRNHI